MPLHPQVELMRQERARAGTPPLYTQTIAEARAADLAAIRAAGGAGEPVHQVSELVFPGPDGDLPARLYRPSDAPELPTLVYLFGGGWALGCVDTADGIARSLANLAGCAVLVPGYRLAPEHPFPAAVHDCLAAVRWLAGTATDLGLDPSRIAVGGDSAGGNLAAAVTLLARDAEVPLAGQLLVYPNTDFRADTASMRENADPLLFNRHSTEWYWGHYLADPADGKNPLVSPLRADDLGGLPPALVITAEYDPLRDEGEAYADRLREAGVPVTRTRYDGMVHGFFAMAGVLDDGRVAHAEAADHLRRWFSTDPEAAAGARPSSVVGSQPAGTVHTGPTG